jgi:hypothetical protein
MRQFTRFVTDMRKFASFITNMIKFAQLVTGSPVRQFTPFIHVTVISLRKEFAKYKPNI